jgi:hypothetical protein
MAKQQNQPPIPDLSPEQIASIVQLGRMKGDVRDDFDREVERHLATDYHHKRSYQKMKAAQSARSGQPSALESPSDATRRRRDQPSPRT